MIEKVIPRKIREKFEKEIILAGFDDPNSYFRTSVKISFLFSILISFIVFYKLRLDLLFLPLIFLLSFYSVILLLLFLSFILSDMRAKEAEERLPDTLFLIASNLRSGMPIDKALWFSAKEELGVIGRELKRVSIEISMGVPFVKALRALGNRFKSDIVKRVVDIIIQGVLSGGNIAPLLERVAVDIREQKSLEKEASSSVGMYIWFIIIASTILAPLLFSSSVTLIEIMIRIGGNLEEIPKAVAGPISFSGFSVEFTPEDLYNFSLFTIILINSFTSFVIGEIKYGNLGYGIRYLPILLGISVLLFYFGHSFMYNMFVSILGE